MLAIVTCHYNPAGFLRPIKNFEVFLDSLGPLKQHLYGYQLLMPGTEGVPQLQRLTAHNGNMLWQKERLLKLAIEQLPEQYDKVAWVDADMLFCNPFWYQQTEAILDELPVCQLMEVVHETDRHGSVIRAGKTLGWKVKHQPTDKAWYRPGGAWAARRHIAESCLYDWDIIGGGDAATALAWTGEFNRWSNEVRKWSPRWDAQYQQWGRIQHELVGGRIGVTPGDCVHLWHGDRDNRQYRERIEIIRRHQFDPFADIEINSQGVWEWCTDKPQLHNAVLKYFRRREED